MNMIRRALAASCIAATLAATAFTALPASAQAVKKVIVHHYPLHTVVTKTVTRRRHPWHHSMVTKTVVHHPMRHTIVTKTLTSVGHHPMRHTTVVKKTVIHHP